MERKDRQVRKGRVIGMIGKWRMRAIDRHTGEVVYEAAGRNLITDAGLALAAALLSGDESVGLTVFAIGTDGTEPNASNTALGAEQSRLAFTIRSQSGAKAEFSVYFPSTACAFHIQEAGVFGGSAADAGTPGSGTLFSRFLADYDNSAGDVDLTFDYTVEVQRA